MNGKLDLQRNWKYLAIGAGGLLALLVLPVVSGFTVPAVVAVRDMIDGMVGGKKPATGA
jgi:hypothetical protein